MGACYHCRVHCPNVFDEKADKVNGEHVRIVYRKGRKHRSKVLIDSERPPAVTL